MKTLLELILMDFQAGGQRGPLTRAFITAWRAANPIYGGAPLWALFAPGSGIATMGDTRLERATTAWRARGHARSAGPPTAPGAFHMPSAESDSEDDAPASAEPTSADVRSEAFSAFVASYRDEYDESFYG